MALAEPGVRAPYRHQKESCINGIPSQGQVGLAWILSECGVRELQCVKSRSSIPLTHALLGHQQSPAFFAPSPHPLPFCPCVHRRSSSGARAPRQTSGNIALHRDLRATPHTAAAGSLFDVCAQTDGSFVHTRSKTRGSTLICACWYAHHSSHVRLS